MWITGLEISRWPPDHFKAEKGEKSGLKEKELKFGPQIFDYSHDLGELKGQGWFENHAALR